MKFEVSDFRISLDYIWDTRTIHPVEISLQNRGQPSQIVIVRPQMVKAEYNESSRYWIMKACENVKNETNPLLQINSMKNKVMLTN